MYTYREIDSQTTTKREKRFRHGRRTANTTQTHAQWAIITISERHKNASAGMMANPPPFSTSLADVIVKRQIKQQYLVCIVYNSGELL